MISLHLFCCKLLKILWRMIKSENKFLLFITKKKFKNALPWKFFFPSWFAFTFNKMNMSNRRKEKGKIEEKEKRVEKQWDWLFQSIDTQLRKQQYTMVYLYICRLSDITHSNALQLYLICLHTHIHKTHINNICTYLFHILEFFCQLLPLPFRFKQFFLY